jgi:hypothetical protein
MCDAKAICGAQRRLRTMNLEARAVQHRAAFIRPNRVAYLLNRVVQRVCGASSKGKPLHG